MSDKKTIAIICIALLFGFMFNVVSYGEIKTDGQKDAIMLVMEGDKLSGEEAEKLEDKVKADPFDLSSRSQLLGYYFLKAYDSDSVRLVRQKHVTWIIRKHPDAEIAGLPQGMLYPVLDVELFAQAKELWLKQVETHQKNTAILGNAARFFLFYDREIAEDLLKRAQALEPDNPEWSRRLGHVYEIEMRHQSGEAKREAGAKSLEELERSLSDTTEEEKRFYTLVELSRVTFEVGEFKKAKTYATELLNKSAQHENNWNYGNAVHHGNLILGRLALKSGDLEKAKEYLIEAGKTTGSPQLDSFGPGMILAKELLERGEREAVIKYFQLCANFWKMGKDRLENWISIVKEGGIPDFGANLDY